MLLNKRVFLPKLKKKINKEVIIFEAEGAEKAVTEEAVAEEAVAEEAVVEEAVAEEAVVEEVIVEEVNTRRNLEHLVFKLFLVILNMKKKLKFLMN